MRLLPLFLLTGCALIDAATSEKPDSRQQGAMGDIFAQFGTAADVIDDPSSASGGDLVELMQFRQYARLVEPSISGKPQAKSAKPEGLPGCIDTLENGDRQVDCDVTLPDGRRCKVTGLMSSAAAEAGSRYSGGLVLGPSPDCPTGSLDFDFYLEGPTDAPLVADGNLSFRYEDPQGDNFSGTGVASRIATGKCEVPSQGELVVTVKGTVDMKPIDSKITIGFHDDPGCGVTLIE